LPEEEPIEDFDPDELPFEDLLDDDFLPELSEDDLLPDDTEISLDDDLFEDDAEVEEVALDGELEPDEVLSVEGLGAEDFPIEEVDGSAVTDEQDFLAQTDADAQAAIEEAREASADGAQDLEEAAAAQASEADTVDPEKLAQARMFEYLAGLTGQLPPETAQKAEDLRLPERLDNLAKVLAGENPEGLPIRTRRDRRSLGDRRQGPRRGESAREPESSAMEAVDETVVVSETFDMIGKIGRLLPPEQKKQLRDRMKKIIDVMEKYRK
jgi:hypothetical protein